MMMKRRRRRRRLHFYDIEQDVAFLTSTNDTDRK